MLVKVWVAGQGPNDATLLADFCAKPGWACDRDPVAALELTIRDLGDVTEYHTNGIPDHATGTFPNQGNPNTIHTVFQTWHVLKMPERSAVGTEMATLGIMLDGLKLQGIMLLALGRRSVIIRCLPTLYAIAVADQQSIRFFDKQQN